MHATFEHRAFHALMYYTTEGEHRHFLGQHHNSIYLKIPSVLFRHFSLLVLLLIFPFFLFISRFVYPYFYQALTLSPRSLNTLNILERIRHQAKKYATKIHGHFFCDKISF